MPITVETRYQRPSEDGMPALALQVTRLVNSYMIWVGGTGEESAEVAIAEGRLGADWACAMPPIALSNASATSLFCSSNADAALSISQRLARRFKKQIFLSIDISISPTSPSQSARVIIDIEKFLVKTLKELES